MTFAINPSLTEIIVAALVAADEVGLTASEFQQVLDDIKEDSKAHARMCEREFTSGGSN
jgi:archaellum component FlaG (FlaF/FlaG flagellin family)